MIVTCLPSYTGWSATLREGLSVGWVPLPNQYSGRYRKSCRYEMFDTLKYVLLEKGKM